MNWQLISGILGFLVLVGSAAVVLLARRHDVARETAERNVNALKSLLATRDVQLADQLRDLQVLESEHKQLIQVNSKEMVSGWFKFQQTVTASENARLRAHIDGCDHCTLLTTFAREPKA